MRKELMLIVVLFFTMLGTSNAQERSKVEVEDCKIDTATKRILLNRLSFIKTIDKSKLSHEERKKLRLEVADLKSKLDIVPTGIYISTGVLILVSVLLIALL
jgi:hypothetical protein